MYRRIRSIDTPLTDRYLFVIAHPRSGSTVLSHVLQSHPDISGFGEHHEGYETDDDLRALAERNAFFARQARITYQYTLDKIVWNHHAMSSEVLLRSDTRFVFLVREPVSTLESYRRMFHDMSTDEDRLESYRSRLDGMIGLARHIGDPERMAFVTYDELTGDTRSTLERLTGWLELATPLTPEYELNAKSGSQSRGDPSKHIQAGTIINVAHESSEIDVDILDAAHRVYDESFRNLTSLTTASDVRLAEQRPVRESR